MRCEARACRLQPYGRADMKPLAVMDDGPEPSGIFGAVVKLLEREHSVLDTVEEAPVQDLDAGEDIGRDFALAAASGNAERVEEIVARPLIADRSGRSLHQQQRIHSFFVEGLCRADQCWGDTVEPEYVAVERVKHLTKQRQRLLYATAGFEQLGLAREFDLWLLTRSERRRHHLGLVVQIDDS